MAAWYDALLRKQGIEAPKSAKPSKYGNDKVEAGGYRFDSKGERALLAIC